MGAFDEIPNITLPNPDDAETSAAFRKKWKWEPHEQVTIRGTYTAADQEIVENAASAIKREGKRADIDMRTGTMRRTLLERMIVGWTFAQGGAPVPVTKETIGRLPPNYRNPILEQIDEITGGMSEEEQEDFLPGVSAPTPTI